MKYEVYKLKFPYGVHFGDKLLEKSSVSFMADTLFSALCIEAIKRSAEDFNYFYENVKEGNILLSDAFPFVDDELLLPKPYIRVDSDEEDSSKKKKFKKIKYVAMSKWIEYLNGQMNPDEEIAIEKRIGKFDVKTHASIRGLDETMPYRIGTFSFNENAGLYIIYAATNDEVRDLFYDLLDGLSFSGIGGKRSSGLGRFEIYDGELPEVIQEALNNKTKKNVTLSISLPREDELESAIEGGTYMLEKRSGFVDSCRYADTYMRKRDLYMFSAGSVFENRFSGDIYDVSSGGNHPVYRYGKPIFLGV